MIILRLASLTLAAGLAWAQPTVAPTPAWAGKSRGEDIGGFNVVNSFETGYRFRSAGGDLGKYRSDVNFGNGVRLLSSFLSVHSKEGHGRLFNEIVLSTQGLGNDPYQFSSFRIQKNRLYRYDFTWRLNEYVNPALAVAGGRHLINTSRRLQDHDLTLLPQSRFKLFLGYTRNKQDGPALVTAQQFDSVGDEFPLFANIRRTRNEYRLGGEIGLWGLRLNVLRGWDRFEEHTPVSLAAPSAGDNPRDPTTLDSLRRTEPYRGTTPYWRVSLLSEHSKWAVVSGRFTHALGRRSFAFDEAAQGTDGFGGARNRQILVAGDGRRPVTTGSLTLSLLPSRRFTVANHTAFHHTRMEGDSAYREINNSTLLGPLLFFRYLGIQTQANTTDATLRAARWLSLYGGYQYSTRRIRTVEQFALQANVERTPTEQNNRIHAELVGVQIQPVKPLAFRLDAEVGRADRPFLPIGEGNYHALGARARYRSRVLQISATARTNYNVNSTTLTSHSSKSRVYSVDAAWTPRDWFAVDAGYSKRRLDTVSGIAYFASSEFIRGEQSLYLSNLHAANLGTRVGIRSRADFYFGYSHVEDTGDGRGAPAAGAARSTGRVFLAAQTFPVAFRSPLARLSIRLHERLRWNFGYQYYGYREDFFAERGYRAHTGYTSVLWSF